MDKIHTAILLVLLISIPSAFTWIWYDEQAKVVQLNAKIGEMDMMLSDVELIEGEVRSPPVLIQLEEPIAFFDKVRGIKAVSVYFEDVVVGLFFTRIRRTYYVFTEDYNIGYYYTVRR